MKIILLSSIRGQTSAAKNAVDVIAEELLKEDYTLYHRHVTQISQEDLDAMDDKENLRFHKEIITNLKKSDVVVAESSNQSLSVGYLISRAVELGKPAIIFYNHQAPEPNLFPTLVKAERLFLVRYNKKDELRKLVKEYLILAKEQKDVRFNFFISPAIGNYLDWISREKKVPRSVYLRNLIEDDMESNDEYNQ